MTGHLGTGVRLAHVAVIVQDLDRTERLYARIFQFSSTGRTLVMEQGARISFLSLGSDRIELLEPHGASGALARFLTARGEGIHHLALEVPNLEQALARARAAGLEVTRERTRPGAEGSEVVFLHPRSAHGLLVEFVRREADNPPR